MLDSLSMALIELKCLVSERRTHLVSIKHGTQQPICCCVLFLLQFKRIQIVGFWQHHRFTWGKARHLGNHPFIVTSISECSVLCVEQHLKIQHGSCYEQVTLLLVTSLIHHIGALKSDWAIQQPSVWCTSKHAFHRPQKHVKIAVFIM